MAVHNFGLIGCGTISDRHINAIKSIENINLVAVADARLERAKNLGEKYNIEYSDNYRKILDNPEIEAVSLCVPNYEHVNLALEAIEKGKNVLLEKPISVNLEDADKLIKKAGEKNIKLAVVKQLRYNQTVKILKKAIEKGKLGKILSANVTVRWNRNKDYYQKKDWVGKKEKSGGNLMNIGSHYIDILQFLLGKAEKVFGKTLPSSIEDVKIEDTAHGLVTFENSVLALIEFTTATYNKNWECSLTILGEQGTVKLGGNYLDKFDFWNVENYPQPEIKEVNLNPNEVNLNFKELYENFVKLLENKDADIADGESAKKSLEIVLAIYKSAEEGREILL